MLFRCGFGEGMEHPIHRGETMPIGLHERYVIWPLLNILVLATVGILFSPRFKLQVDDVGFGLTTQVMQKAW